MRYQQPYATLTPLKTGAVLFESSYDPQLVAVLKSQVPPAGRRWDRDQRAWLIAPEHAATVAAICARIFGIQVDVPHLKPKQLYTRAVMMKYLGTAKDRGDDDAIAYGWADGKWSLAFPLSVLRAWFCDDESPTEATTLYGTLGVKRNTGQDEVKQAYRRAARTWHPDVGGDAEQFRTIQHAYEVLSDPDGRARYDSGLAMEATLSANQRPAPRVVWKPPARCGFLLVEGREVLDRFTVSRILEWQDIMDGQGRTLVTYWPAGADEFKEKWA